MAGNAIIGALRVVLGADTAALETGLKGAQRSLAAFGAGAGKSLAAAGAAMNTIAVGMAVAIKGSINEADKLNKMSQSVGMPVDELSKLKYAAELSDVSLEQLGVSLGKLSKNMSLMAGGAAGPAAEALKAMGLSVKNTDGTLKTSGEVLASVADKFKGYEDGAAKTALAIAIFGKAGAAMIPLLNQGRDGLKEAGDEAARFGLVLTKETAQQAENFNDNLTRMSKILSGASLKVTAEMLPAMENLSSTMVMAANNSELMSTVASAMSGVIRGLASVAIGASAAFRSMALDFTMAGDVISKVTSLRFGEAWSAIAKWREDTKKVFAETGALIDNLWKDPPKQGSWEFETASLDRMNASILRIGEAWAKTSAPIIEATTKAKTAIQSYTDSVQKRIAGMTAEAETIGKGAFQADALRVKLEGLAVAAAAHVPTTAALTQAMTNLGISFAAANEKAGFAKQIYEQTRTPTEQFSATMEQLNGALQRGAIDADTYARAVAQAQDKMVQANPAAQILGNSLETAFGRAMEKGAQLGDVLRSLLHDLAKAGASQIFKQLLYGNASMGGASNGVLCAVFARPKWGR